MGKTSQTSVLAPIDRGQCPPERPAQGCHPAGLSDVVCRGSLSPSREVGGKGPRPTDSPHPSVGPRRAGKFSKSKSEVVGRGSRSPSREGRGKGPRPTDSPHPSGWAVPSQSFQVPHAISNFPLDMVVPDCTDPSAARRSLTFRTWRSIRERRAALGSVQSGTTISSGKFEIA